MNVSIAEQEPKERERVVKLNEEFTPWDPTATRVINNTQPLNLPLMRFESDINIRLTEILKIPASFLSYHSESLVIHCISPFHRQNGYQIDARDLDPEKRLEKYKQLTVSHQELDYRLDPNCLRVLSNQSTLEKAGINKKTLIYEFSSEMTSLLKRFRLKLKFPGSDLKVKKDDPGYFSESVYESKPWDMLLDMGSISFDSFYPADTGSLPKAGVFYQGGHKLYTPASLDVLKTIKAEFYLAEEEKEEQSPEVPVQKPPSEYTPPLGVKRK